MILKIGDTFYTVSWLQSKAFKYSFLVFPKSTLLTQSIAEKSLSLTLSHKTVFFFSSMVWKPYVRKKSLRSLREQSAGARYIAKPSCGCQCIGGREKLGEREIMNGIYVHYTMMSRLRHKLDSWYSLEFHSAIVGREILQDSPSSVSNTWWCRECCPTARAVETLAIR